MWLEIPELKVKLSNYQCLFTSGSYMWSETIYDYTGASITKRLVDCHLLNWMGTLGGRGDHYLSIRHWHLLQDHSYGGSSRYEDTVPGNSLFLYSLRHPAETCPLLGQTEPRPGLRGHGHSAAAGTPHRLRSCPSGHRTPCPTDHGRKLPRVRNICLTHSLVAIVASLSKIQK